MDGGKTGNGVWNDDLAAQFDGCVRISERQRQQAFFHADIEQTSMDDRGRWRETSTVGED